MIKVGQIGLNYGLNVQIPAFLNDSRFQLTSICSRNMKKNQEIAKKLGISHFTDSPEELFSMVDAVSLAVPPNDQARFLKHALKEGLHVFFEKPLGFTFDRKHNFLNHQALVADFEFMEIDVWKDLKQLIARNELGSVLHAEVIWNVETYAVSKKLNSWKTNSKLSGGALNNFAAHSLHYMEKFMGKISEVDVKALQHESHGEEVVYIYLKFFSGASASLCISTNTYKGSGHSLEFTCSEGTALLRNKENSTVSDFTLEVHKKSGETYHKESLWKKRPGEDDRILAVSSLVKKFGDWIENGEPQEPGISEATRVENLLNMCKLSIERNKIISIKV